MHPKLVNNMSNINTSNYNVLHVDTHIYNNFLS